MCKGPKHHPDSFFSWFISVCSSVCQALNLGFAMSFGILLPELMKEFRESRQKTVWVGSLAVGLTFFFGPLGSLLCQTIGCRLTSIIGCLLCAVSLLVTPYSSRLDWMFLSYGCVFGIGSALMLSSYFLITAKNFRRWQSLAVGIVTIGGSSGLLIMGPLLQLLIDSFGWRVTYRIVSIPFFLMAFVSGVAFVEPIQDASETTSHHHLESQSDPEFLYLNEECPDDCLTKTQRTNQMISFEVAANTEGSMVSNSTRKSNTLLDFSVFKIPSYTFAVLSLCFMNFGHFIPQIHMVSRFS